MKTCKKCNEQKSLIEYCKRKDTKDGYHRYCKECSYTISAKYYHTTGKELRKDYYDQYRKDNKEYYNQYVNNHYHNNKEYYREYNNTRSATDPIFRLKHAINSNININLRKYLQIKKDKSLSYLGITMEEYCTYLENQFTPEMNWDNYGSYWEIDHIIPIDSFDLSDEKQLYECFNYKNTQPLYWLENKQKSNKLTLKS
jgi:hypothetical protein